MSKLKLVGILLVVVSIALYSDAQFGGIAGMNGAILDWGTGIMEIPNGSSTVSGDCDAAGEVGRVYVATGSTSGQQFKVCESGGWVAQGDGVGSGYTIQSAGTNGTDVTNAGDNTSLARSDHEHLVPWQVGPAIETTPSTGDMAPRYPVPANCGGTISVTSVRVVFATKGTGSMTFQAYKCTNGSSESCSSMYSAGNQTYSNSGNVSQVFNVDQNNTSLNTTDYFKISLASVNGQDDGSITVQGRCKNL